MKIAKDQLAGIEKKIENTEKNLFDEVVKGDTYKKWMKKLSAEKAQLEDQMSYRETDLKDFINQELLVLPYTLNIPAGF